MDHQPGATHEALPLDPENDIDAGKAFWWFIGSTVVLFGALWLFVPVFIQVQDFEVNRKINLAPTTEFDNVKKSEFKFLNGENPSKKNIDDVVKNWK